METVLCLFVVAVILYTGKVVVDFLADRAEAKKADEMARRHFGELKGYTKPRGKL